MSATVDATRPARGDGPTRPLSRDGARHHQISQLPYMPGLDGIRAVAVVAVMVYHANSSWLAGGYLGVEVFFVISGYLITLLLIAEHERSGRIDLTNFWIRRFRRLLPALFVMMLLLAVWVALFERGLARQAARRRDRRNPLRNELLPDLHRCRIQRRKRLRTAAPPVEPGRRRTVLRRLAARDDGLRPRSAAGASPGSPAGCSWRRWW